MRVNSCVWKQLRDVMISAGDYVFLDYVRGSFCGSAGDSLTEVCLTNFALFVNHFLCVSGPTSQKMYLWCMLCSWYGSVPVEYDARSSIT